MDSSLRFAPFRMTFFGVFEIASNRLCHFLKFIILNSYFIILNCILGAAMDHSLVTTNFQLDGYKIVKNIGVVRGIIVRSRSLFGNIGAGFQILFGGNITLYTSLCEQTRRDAYEVMIQHAEQLGGNAVIGFRYDATEIMNGVTEVLAYGTACIVQKI
jgi:uncharacterized protein YbjQ (UPF0145 family)